MGKAPLGLSAMLASLPAIMLVSSKVPSRGTRSKRRSVALGRTGKHGARDSQKTRRIFLQPKTLGSKSRPQGGLEKRPTSKPARRKKRRGKKRFQRIHRRARPTLNSAFLLSKKVGAQSMVRGTLSEMNRWKTRPPRKRM